MGRGTESSNSDVGKSYEKLRSKKRKHLSSSSDSVEERRTKVPAKSRRATSRSRGQRTNSQRDAKAKTRERSRNVVLSRRCRHASDEIEQRASTRERRRKSTSRSQDARSSHHRERKAKAKEGSARSMPRSRKRHGSDRDPQSRRRESQKSVSRSGDRCTSSDTEEQARTRERRKKFTGRSQHHDEHSGNASSDVGISQEPSFAQNMGNSIKGEDDHSGKKIGSVDHATNGSTAVLPESISFKVEGLRDEDRLVSAKNGSNDASVAALVDTSHELHRSKVEEKCTSGHDAAAIKPDAGLAKSALDSIGNIAALKQRLDEERKKLSLLKELREYEQHEMAEQNEEVREKEFFKASIGETIGSAKQLRVEERIGCGHFAHVFRCKDIHSGADYAVKVLRASPVVRKAGEKEVDILKVIQEEACEMELDGIQNIVCLVGPQKFEHAGHLCLVFSLLRYDLHVASRQLTKGNGLPPACLHRYGTNLFSALRLLHALGIVHTDIKPDNLLVSHQKDRRGLDFVQLADFGSAKRMVRGGKVERDKISFSGYVSPRFYRAPEVFLGQSYDSQVDVWSAGATLFEMATGQILFEGSTSNAMIHSILSISGDFPVMFSTLGLYSAKHFSRNGDFLLDHHGDSTAAQKIPMSQFAHPHQVMKRLEKHMGINSTESVPEVLLRRLSQVIEHCVVPDPSRRITAQGALELEFCRKGSRR